MAQPIVLSLAHYALVDDGDFYRVSKLRWYASREGGRVIARSVGRENHSLSQYLLVTEEPVAYLNGNSLDCRKENLIVWVGRTATWKRASNKPESADICPFPRIQPTPTPTPKRVPEAAPKPARRRKPPNRHRQVILRDGILHVGRHAFGPFESEALAQRCHDLAILHFTGIEVDAFLAGSEVMYAELVQEAEAEMGPKDMMSVFRRMVDRVIEQEKGDDASSCSRTTNGGNDGED